MKSFFLACLAIFFTAGSTYSSQSQVVIASQGETLITATAGKLNVNVKIQTHEVQIGKPSDNRPPIVQNCCTYSKYPCSIVDRIVINVSGNTLNIPRSVFCDLADLNRAEVKLIDKGATLKLYGGDASESYVVSIEFNSLQIKRRVLYSSLSIDQPLQETIYHAQSVGD